MKAGDVVLVRGRSIFSDAVRAFTRSPGEAPTRVTHVALAIDSRHIIEAGRSGVVIRTRDRGVCYHPRNVSAAQAARIVAHAMEYLGKPYGWLKIAAHAVGLQRWTTLDGAPICSTVVAVPYMREGLTFGVDARVADPDDIADFVTFRPDLYSLVP